MQPSLTLGIAVAALVCSCGGPYDTGGTGSIATTTPTAPTAPAPPAPQVTTVAPDDHHQFEFESEDDDESGNDAFDVEVRVSNASLAEPRKCSGSAPCGHLVLLIDGVACGNPNATSSGKKFRGNFGKCATASGTHQIVVQLVDDRGNVLAASQPVTVTVKKKHG